MWHGNILWVFTLNLKDKSLLSEFSWYLYQLTMIDQTIFTIMFKNEHNFAYTDDLYHLQVQVRPKVTRIAMVSLCVFPLCFLKLHEWAFARKAYCNYLHTRSMWMLSISNITRYKVLDNRYKKQFKNTFGKNIYCFLQQTDYLSPMIRADAMNALCRFFSSG